MDQFARQRHKCHAVSQKKRPKKTSPPAEVPPAPEVPVAPPEVAEVPPEVPPQHPRLKAPARGQASHTWAQTRTEEGVGFSHGSC